jgi:serine protease SohB
MPNFHRLLDKAGIDFEQHTAGEFKRTVTMFGENSDKEREKLRLELQEVHTLFRDFVVENRPKLDIDKVATGEHWYGKQAIKLNLVDEIKTSDEFIVDALKEYDIFGLKLEHKKSFQEKFLGGMFASVKTLKKIFAQEQNNSRFS